MGKVSWKNIWESAWAPAALIAVLIITAYSPVLNAGFIWDDDAHLTTNPCIIGPLGFKDIWISSHAVYYPLVLTSFWVLHKFVGLNPLPYHVLNVIMHAGAAVLLWRVLRQLNVRGAWLGAALWALHPVIVQSVAWITELKNTQSCFFYLLSILLFLKADNFESERQKYRWRFGLSLLFFALAITSKPSVVMLPVVLGLCLWWKHGRLRRHDLVALIPFLFISAAASGWTIWEQKFHAGASGADWAQTWVERLVIAGHDIWFYLGKLFWPNPLSFIYPRWKIDITQLTALLPFLAAALALSLLWWKRKGPLRPVFFAAAYFVASLFPLLGFFNVFFFRYSFVSDHFQYLASIGVLALVGSGVATITSSVGKGRSWLKPVLYTVPLLILGALTWRQTTTYRDLETLWRTTIATNPGCWLAHTNLGALLKERGHKEEAKVHYLEALKLKPDFAEALDCWGVIQAENGQIEEAIASFRGALKSYPNYAPAFYNLGNAFAAKREPGEAIASYQASLRIWPNQPEAHNNLAVVLSQSGKLDEAVGHYVEALHLKPGDAGAHNNLGVVLTQLKHFDEAEFHLREALRFNHAFAQAHINLARLLAQQGRHAEAVENSTEALRIAPDHPEAKRQLRELGVEGPP